MWLRSNAPLSATSRCAAMGRPIARCQYLSDQEIVSLWGDYLYSSLGNKTTHPQVQIVCYVTVSVTGAYTCVDGGILRSLCFASTVKIFRKPFWNHVRPRALRKPARGCDRQRHHRPLRGMALAEVRCIGQRGPPSSTGPSCQPPVTHMHGGRASLSAGVEGALGRPPQARRSCQHLSPIVSPSACAGSDVGIKVAGAFLRIKNWEHRRVSGDLDHLFFICPQERCSSHVI